MSPVLCVIYKRLAWGEMLDGIVPIWYFGYTVVVSVVMIVEGYPFICSFCGGTCTIIVYSCDVAIGRSWTMNGCIVQFTVGSGLDSEFAVVEAAK